MHFFIDLIEYGTCDFWYFFDILTPEDQIAANLTPINDVCRVVRTCQPVLPRRPPIWQTENA